MYLHKTQVHKPPYIQAIPCTNSLCQGAELHTDVDFLYSSILIVHLSFRQNWEKMLTQNQACWHELSEDISVTEIIGLCDCKVYNYGLLRLSFNISVTVLTKFTLHLRQTSSHYSNEQAFYMNIMWCVRQLGDVTEKSQGSSPGLRSLP
jgi:hypothetical protein